MATWNRWKGQETTGGRYTWVSGVISPTLWHPHWRAERSSTDKYCVFESSDITVGELQNSLTEVVDIWRANAVHIAMEEAPTLKNFLRNKLKAASVKPALKQSDTLPHDTSMTVTASSNWWHQLMPPLKSLSPSHYLSASTCLLRHTSRTSEWEIYVRPDAKHFSWRHMCTHLD